jgi:hypothetical protein
VAAVEKGELGCESKAAVWARVGERDAFWFVVDDPAVDAFVVVQVLRPECRVEPYDGDVGGFREAWDERDA